MMPIFRLLSPALFYIATVCAGQTTWPTKSITLVAPTLPGSDGDIIARSVGQSMSQLTGVPVVVENRAGASGTLGVATTARAAPDGYTSVITGTGPFILSPLLNKQLGYDMEKSLEPVSLMSTFASTVVVGSDSPYKTLGDLIAAAKAQPGKLTFGSSGQGTLVHLQGELLKIRTGINVLHVPYKSQTPALMAVISQEITFMILPSASAQQLIHSGRLRALGVTSDARMKSLPDVPTMAEAGVQNFVVKGWYGAYVPAGTPHQVIQKFSEEVRRALQTPEVTARLNLLGMDVVGSTPEQLLQTWRADSTVWSQVLKANPQIRLEQ
jgi:tripartite-type tricarboxylate transporter receptor subunit TctC